jgi:hypothetical protein
MIIDLTTGQESTDGLGWDTSLPFTDQTDDVKIQALNKAIGNFLNGDYINEEGDGNSRPQTISFVDGIALYTITPVYYSDIVLKSFMLTRRINLTITENIT